VTSRFSEDKAVIILDLLRMTSEDDLPAKTGVAATPTPNKNKAHEHEP
jgi:hypothetical protein